MASTRQGSRQYRKLKVSNDQGFSLSAIGDTLEQFSKDVKNFNFDLARKDLDEIKISHRKIENRGQVITSIEIDEKKKIQ